VCYTGTACAGLYSCTHCSVAQLSVLVQAVVVLLLGLLHASLYTTPHNGTPCHVCLRPNRHKERCVDVHDMSWARDQLLAAVCGLSGATVRGVCAPEQQAQAARCLPSADNWNRYSRCSAICLCQCGSCLLAVGCHVVARLHRVCYTMSASSTVCERACNARIPVFCCVMCYGFCGCMCELPFWLLLLLHAGVYSMSGETRYNARWLARSNTTYVH
jgi:hypothetical protein